MNTPSIPEKVVAAATARGYWKSVFFRLMRDKVTVVCLLVLLAVVFMASFAPLIAPYDPFMGSIL